jgi:hypothetical protein
MSYSAKLQRPVTGMSIEAFERDSAESRDAWADSKGMEHVSVARYCAFADRTAGAAPMLRARSKC